MLRKSGRWVFYADQPIFLGMVFLLCAGLMLSTAAWVTPAYESLMRARSETKNLQEVHDRLNKTLEFNPAFSEQSHEKGKMTCHPKGAYFSVIHHGSKHYFSGSASDMLNFLSEYLHDHCEGKAFYLEINPYKSLLVIEQ
jgi:hypothetical protein